MLCRLAAWGVVGLTLSGSWLACSDTKQPRRTPVPIGGEGGEGSQCESCAGSGASDAGTGGEPRERSLALSAISLTQSVEVGLMREGEPLRVDERAVPIVAAKRALVRAFVTVGPSHVKRPLLGVLDLKAGARSRSWVSELTPSRSSLQDDLATTFTFDVSGSELGTSTEYRLRVLEQDTKPLLQFPEAGYTPLGARSLEPFELVLVPMTTNGHAPRVSEVELGQVERRLLALYPAASVRVSVAPPFVSPRAVDGEGEGWEESLDDLLELRAEAATPARAFYYGLLAPAAGYSQYCGDSCVLGLSNVAEADSDYERGAVGIAVFSDGSGSKVAWDTLAHELGHALGRNHSDCGEPDFPDPYNPYEDGGLGPTYGYDFVSGRLIKPKQYRDVMSYCEPVWVSDYTYAGLFERLAAIDRQEFRLLERALPTPFRIARIDRFGQSSWRRERTSRRGGQLAAFSLLDATGHRVGVARGRVSRLDHLPGGSVWLIASDLRLNGAHSVDLRSAGGSVLAL